MVRIIVIGGEVEGAGVFWAAFVVIVRKKFRIKSIGWPEIQLSGGRGFLLFGWEKK